MICLQQTEIADLRVGQLEHCLGQRLHLPVGRLQVMIFNEESIAIRRLADTPANQRAVQQILNELVPD